MNIEYKRFKSEHYIFYFEPNSLADQEIEEIAKEQENCFQSICNTLGITFTEKICYYLMDSPEKVGILFGGNDPINAFAVLGENKIYAVYNPDVKCIGFHEDTHLISATLGIPQSEFLLEGLAMFFDKTWWGLQNERWACYYKTKSQDISIKSMLETKDFYSFDCMIFYPISGAFIQFLIDRYGLERFKTLYQYPGSDYINTFESIYPASFSDIESAFWCEMLSIEIDIAQIEKLLI